MLLLFLYEIFIMFTAIARLEVHGKDDCIVSLEWTLACTSFKIQDSGIYKEEEKDN